MKGPNFFIIGAPKCGTTALSQYLSSHPDICFSDSKEPNYFCTDFPKYCNSFSEDEYLDKEFGHCTASSKAIGEGSVVYLYSENAVERILQFNPHSKLIVMLRNPLDVVQSLHSQLLNNLDEDVEDFEKAWQLQDLRQRQRHLPPLCREPRFLQYREVVKFGAQLQRLLSLAPRNQVKIIFFEAFANDTRKIYKEILAFLGLEDDGRTNFPKINENKDVLSRSIAHLIHRPPQFAISITKWLKNVTGIRRFGLSRTLASFGDQLNSRRTSRQPITPQLQETILQELAEDITLLEQILRIDLSHWKTIQRN
ncbi:MAG: hypothetical protein BMS9Abin02_1256 [Anaerolineae bacterium]|nr:MAG: hypothetical protein BMS9Abin02_1256 [Anaerolineae bacterium]